MAPPAAECALIVIIRHSIYRYQQIPDLPAIMGMVLIIAGVLVINLLSKMNVH